MHRTGKLPVVHFLVLPTMPSEVGKRTLAKTVQGHAGHRVLVRALSVVRDVLLQLRLQVLQARQWDEAFAAQRFEIQVHVHQYIGCHALCTNVASSKQAVTTCC